MIIDRVEPLLGMAQYHRYLTFREVPEREVAEWTAALTLFYRKLT
jgi:hypothetical protein